MPDTPFAREIHSIFCTPAHKALALAPASFSKSDPALAHMRPRFTAASSPSTIMTPDSDFMYALVRRSYSVPNSHVVSSGGGGGGGCYCNMK